MLKRKTCPTCKQGFQPRSEKQIYCMEYCYPSANKISKPETKRICKVCHKEFLSTNRQICSVQCYVVHDREQKSKRRKERKNHMPKAVCLWCHELFSQIHPQHIFCFLDCGNEYRKMRKKVFNLPSKIVQSELEKLANQGKNYRLIEAT